MTSPKWNTHWEVSAWHPDKVDPFDVTIKFLRTSEEAEEFARSLREDGWQNINITPPENLTRPKVPVNLKR